MKYSNELISRVFKDLQLPFNYVNPEHLTYALSVCSDSKAKWDFFEEEFDKIGNEMLFFKESKRIIDSVIEEIKPYIPDSLNEIDAKLPNATNKVLNDKIYHPDNVDKEFISIDIIKGNFSSIKFFNDEFPYETYENLIAAFSDHVYYVKSKQIRQVIFGNVNPKRQQYMMKKIINDLWGRLEYLNVGQFSTGSDEIILRDERPFLFHDLTKLINDLPYGDLLDIDQFTLKRSDNFTGYIKVRPDGKETHHCVSKNDYLRHMKAHLGKPLEPMDNWFIHEKRLATYL